MRAWLCGFVILFVGVLPAGAEGPVKWVDTPFETIVESARHDGRYVFIDFYATWCGPCKELEKTTYVDERVVEFLNDMIPVKYDAEKDVGVELAKRYRVSAYPTLVLLGNDGEEIDRHVGYLDADEFLTVMTDYTKGVNTVADYRERVKRDPNDAESWKAIGMKGAYAGRPEEAVNALGHYLELKPDLPVEDRAEVLFMIAEAHYENEAYGEAARVAEQLLGEYKGSDSQESAVTSLLARTYHKLGDNDKSVKVYLDFVSHYPESPRALNAFAWFCAKRGVGLDEALPYALKAVELTGRDAGYLDTLAELYFARAQYDKAIEVGAEAAGKDPEDGYLKEQLEKFKRAKAEADAQASH